MKRVKIMLMTALVVASVGGALAFKAQKFSTGLFCGATGSCATQDNINAYTTVDVDPDNKVPNISCSTVQNGTCTSVRVE